MVRTGKPCHQDLLKRKFIEESRVSNNFKIIYEQHCKYYNKGAKELRMLRPNERVMFWKYGVTWVRGTVINKRDM